MAGGIGGFAEGFSSGLGQGMGIISQVRADKRAKRAQDLQEEQMRHTMGLQNKADARATEAHADQMETSKWHKANIRPWTAEKARLEVDQLELNIETMGYEAAMKKFQADHQDEAWAMQVTEHENRMEWGEREQDRQDASLEETLRMGSFNREMGRKQDTRAQLQSDIALAGSVLGPYAEMISRGITPPKAMQDIVANSPFGISSMLELARASEAFPTILEQASKGNFSFMQNGEMAESAMSLARPVGMSIARQQGFDAMSARVIGMTPTKGGMAVEIMARDPKSGTYRKITKVVATDKLASQMEVAARSGAALKGHPAYETLQQNLPGYLSAVRGDVRQAAGKDWDDKFQQFSKVLNEGDESNPDYKIARQWLEANPNRARYMEQMAAGSYRAQNGRGDASPSDWGRVSSVVSRFTGLTAPDDVNKRANGALAIMNKLRSAPASKIPGIVQLIRDNTGDGQSTFRDPAKTVQMYYLIQKDPKLRAELAGALSGGSGSSRPRKGGGLPPGVSPLADARGVLRKLFPQAQLTDWKRDPDSKLGKANPSSWHNRTGAAIDIKPIPGMSFDRFVSTFERAGYRVIEKMNEVGSGRSKHATGDHWHLVLGLPTKAQAAARGGGLKGFPAPDRHSINGKDLRPYGYVRY